MKHTLRPSRSTLAGAATVTVLALTACTSAADDGDSVLISGVEVDPAADSSPGDGVRLLTAGAADRITLPVPYEVGNSATTEMTIEIELGVDGRSEAGGFVMVMDQTVTDLSDDLAVVETTLDSVIGTGFAAGDPEIEGIFDEVIGVPLVGEVDAAGLPVGELRRVDGGRVPDAITDQMTQVDTEIDFPTEPVGVGAVWTAVTEVEEGGFRLEAETRFDLVELNDDEYVVEMTQRVPIDERLDGVRIEGLLEATGTMTVARDNPLHVDMDYRQTGSYSADGITFELDIDLALTSE